MKTMYGASLFENNENVYINYHRGEDIALHNHDFIEIAYVVKGRGIHYLGDSQMEIEQGDYFIINTGVVHGYRDIEEMTVYNCVFTADFLDASMLGIQNFHDLLDHYLFRHMILSDTSRITESKFRANAAINDLFLNMYEEFSGKPNGYIQILRMDIVRLLILTLRYNNAYGLRLPNKQNEAYNGVIRHLCENYARKLSLEELSKAVFVSPEHFCRTFKAYTGVTVWSFIKMVRMDKAKTLLLNTDKTVSQIAELVGYTDEKHFSKVFKSEAGVSPSGFKKRSLSSADPPPARGK